MQGKSARTTAKIRKLLVMVAALLIGTLTVFGVSQIAEATTNPPAIRHGSLCMFLSSASGNISNVTLGDCGRVGSHVKLFRHGTYNGHPVIQIQFDSLTHPYCVDSFAQKSGNVRANPQCNTGSYQRFEVFTTSSGKRVLKSLGAWQHQHVHICISSSNTKGAVMTFATCNTAAAAQQFQFAV